MTASTFKTIEKPAIDKFDVTPNLDRDNVREFDWQDCTQSWTGSRGEA